MLEVLKKLNPDLPLFSVDSPEFKEYGRVLSGIASEEFTLAAEGVPMPDCGSAYVASLDAFEGLSAAKDIETYAFGTLDTQMGYCYGYNDMLAALEWHTSSEVNVAITPLVLMLAKRSDMEGNELDSACVKAFYLPAGTVIECYATSLHFCPCQVTKDGFKMVVALPRGTNEPLISPVDDPLLFRRNKWLISHRENSALLARGAVGGIYGTNYKLRFSEL